MKKNRVASGVTGGTTAKITAYHGLIYSKLLKQMGTERASAYLQLNTQAVEQYRSLAKKIDCDFQETEHYVYTTTDKAAVLEEIKAIQKLGGRAVYTEKTEIPIETICAVKAMGQGQIHPLMFAKGVAKLQCGNIFEHTFGKKVEKRPAGYQVLVEGERGKDLRIDAGQVIVASHFPFIDRWGMYFMKMYQQRSYVLALENAGALYGMYIGCRAEKNNPLKLSLRSAGKYLLLGGGGGRTGTDHPGLAQLRREARRLFPESKEAAAWAAQDCMTLDGVPYIGPYTSGKPDLLVATGFNKWGMTGAMAAAMTLTGKVDPQQAKVFEPGRNMFHRQLLVNGLETVKNFLRPSAPRCTHLGCALKWEKSEKIWVCPCHGSSFDREGKILENPAQNILKIR